MFPWKADWSSPWLRAGNGWGVFIFHSRSSIAASTVLAYIRKHKCRQALPKHHCLSKILKDTEAIWSNNTAYCMSCRIPQEGTGTRHLAVHTTNHWQPTTLELHRRCHLNWTCIILNWRHRRSHAPRTPVLMRINILSFTITITITTTTTTTTMSNSNSNKSYIIIN